jgi:hypothetical protein
MTMYRTGPPVVDRVSRTTSLRLTRVVRREFTGGSHPTDDPRIHRYYADLAALHGIEYRKDVLETAVGNTFIEMADAVLAELVSDARPIDLVIVAHSLPDLDPWLSVGVSLTRTLPGEPLVFAMSGDGGSTAFTALRVAGDYARRHSYRRVVLLVMDQSTLPYPHDAEPAGDAAVAMLIEDAPGREITMGNIRDLQRPDVSAAIARLFGDAARVVDVDDHDAFPGTGIWSGVTQDRDGYTVLTAYDPARAELRYCAIHGGET